MNYQYKLSNHIAFHNSTIIHQNNQSSHFSFSDYHLGDKSVYLDFVIEETMRHGWQGRVLLGHMTNLSVHTHEQLEVIGRWKVL